MCGRILVWGGLVRVGTGVSVSANAGTAQVQHSAVQPRCLAMQRGTGR